MSLTEKVLVEDYIVDRLREKGWSFVPAEELEREDYDEPLLIPNLIRALRRVNPNLAIGEEEIRQVINELKFAGIGIEGAKKILNFLKSGVPVKFEKERVVRYVKLFDFDEIEKNDFIVSRQVRYRGREDIRVDIILYVNGIPLVNIECKNPTNPAESWYNAYEQIKDYEKKVPELYKYVQIGVAAESVARYFPIVPWQDEVWTYEWKVKGKDSIDSLVEMLSRETLLDLIRNFLFFRIEFGNATKVIARYMQYRAANKMVKRVLDKLKGIEDKNKGLIWHWQGSGKTLTMIFAANKLYYARELENPTIFFIVDRIELEEQLYKEFTSLDIVEPETIGSIRELKKVLSHDDYRGKRGIFITLIHKFRHQELKDLQEELEEISRGKETIMSRRNVIAFIDEGHRTQYGLLAAQMKSILKNAFFFALTGTPISKRGRDTFLEFSYPPEENYLDRYFIADSIEDGFTVKIAYQPRLDDLHLKVEMLETFLEVEFEELPEEIREEVEERVRKRLNAIKLFLENPERIDKIAKDIAEHFKENVDGKFKGMVVTGSRKACVLYKKALDKHLPPNYSEVVMTYTSDDPKVIQDYHEELRERFRGKDDDQIRKEIVERFKEEDFPKILIVTDMLLTGFDAPILQTMYLDKPLKEHRLLQAIARTNRPYKGVKEAGLIVDYVGILKEFKRALEMYSEEDIKGVLYSLEDLREEFNQRMDEILEMFGGIPRNYDRENLLNAIEILTADPQREEDFVESYKKLRKVFELLGPDEIKLRRFEDYKWISAIYIYYLKTVQRRKYEGYVRKYFEKTVKFVHRTTEVKKLEEMPLIVFDEQYLRNLEEKVKSRKEKAANVLFTLNRFVLVDRHKSPIYESLAERVEKLVKLWREKMKDYERIYREGVKIFEEIQMLRRRQKELSFSDMEYSILLTLENQFGRSEGLVEEVRGLSEKLRNLMFPGWISQVTARKKVEVEVRRFVRRYRKKYGLSLKEMDELYERIIEGVMNYGA